MTSKPTAFPEEDAKKSTDANMVEKAITAVEFDGLAELTLSGLKMREFPVLPGGSALAKRIPKVQAVDLSFNEFEVLECSLAQFSQFAVFLCHSHFVSTAHPRRGDLVQVPRTRQHDRM